MQMGCATHPRFTSPSLLFCPDENHTCGPFVIVLRQAFVRRAHDGLLVWFAAPDGPSPCAFRRGIRATSPWVIFAWRDSSASPRARSNNYLPVNIGDVAHSGARPRGGARLYTTGFFRDLQLRREAQL